MLDLQSTKLSQLHAFPQRALDTHDDHTHRCIINLTNGGEECTGVGRRVALLRDRGVSRILSDMQKDRALPIDIRERTKTALENFVALDMFTE